VIPRAASVKFFRDTANQDKLKNQFLKDWAKVFQETPVTG
jgi:hypothetical protein